MEGKIGSRLSGNHVIKATILGAPRSRSDSEQNNRAKKLGHQSSDRKMAEIATITDIGRTFAHY
jgi:hypothetical protein